MGDTLWLNRGLAPKGGGHHETEQENEEGLFKARSETGRYCHISDINS
jgi:hypothetical protein